MEKIFKETILISTKHISDTSLVHPYQKDFTKELQNLGNNVDSFTGYIRKTIQKISEIPEISEV